MKPDSFSLLYCSIDKIPDTEDSLADTDSNDSKKSKSRVSLACGRMVGNSRGFATYSIDPLTVRDWPHRESVGVVFHPDASGLLKSGDSLTSMCGRNMP